MIQTWMPVESITWLPAGGGPGGDLRCRSSLRLLRHLPFTGSWVTTGLHRDLRPPLEIHGIGDSKLQSPAEFSDSDGGGDGGIQGLGAAVISWIWGNVKSVGHQFGYLIGNAVGLVADDDDGRGV